MSVMPVENRSKGSTSSVQDEDKGPKRSLREKALKEEAKSIRHMLTHIPKNPYTATYAKNAKMFKPPSRAVGGSTQVKAEKFGDHITADFIVTRDEDELGIDEEKSALVVKDIATGFVYTPMQEEPPMLLYWQSSISLDIQMRLESSTVTMRRS